MNSGRHKYIEGILYIICQTIGTWYVTLEYTNIKIDDPIDHVSNNKDTIFMTARKNIEE